MVKEIDNVLNFQRIYNIYTLSDLMIFYPEYHIVILLCIVVTS